MGAEEGECGEVGVGEALGLEEMDGGEDTMDGIGRSELCTMGIEEAEGFEVTEVVVMCSAEVEEWRRRRRRRSRGGSVGMREGRDGGEWARESSNRHAYWLLPSFFQRQ